MYETKKGLKGRNSHLGAQSSFILHRFVLINSNVPSWNTLPWAWNDWLHPSTHAGVDNMFPDVSTHVNWRLRISENQWACGEETLWLPDSWTARLLVLFSLGGAVMLIGHCRNFAFLFTKDDIFQPVAGSLHCLLKLVPQCNTVCLSTQCFSTWPLRSSCCYTTVVFPLRDLTASL